MNLNALEIYLEKLFAVKGVVDYAPNGLQVEGRTEINKIATAVTANLETIDAAIERGVDALIVHHGLFWNRDSYVVRGTKKQKLIKLLNAGISLFAYHLPLDMHSEFGNNWAAARQMSWTDLEPFGELNGGFVGVKGKIKSSSKELFQKSLEEFYQHAATVATGGPITIESVALISGGAHKSLAEAALHNIDAFVTGSFDEPSWYLAKEENIHFFAMGHSATERIGPIALAKYLSTDLALTCEFIDVYNPF